ncbi:hypothetical protein Y88_1121 [Novosphingobium nitrogenifigens DSM 19370]|uniref:Uncharacterized protein n=1 Tax=Novosphingobium nitrogenifigens DSM 19370 TaxID=983920 RepID=F1Z8G6_9SPHN|nr:hypothetical protein Y88_1121 [Novosphingobium nitrogenifigens DSM 19370]
MILRTALAKRGIHSLQGECRTSLHSPAAATLHWSRGPRFSATSTNWHGTCINHQVPEMPISTRRSLSPSFLAPPPPLFSQTCGFHAPGRENPCSETTKRGPAGCRTAFDWRQYPAATMPDVIPGYEVPG